MINIKHHIPMVKNWPKQGVEFLDINQIFNNPPVLDHCCAEMLRYVIDHRASSVVAVESRGFIMGSILAHTHKIPLILARKKNKLPGPVYQIQYDTEYSHDAIEIQQSAPVGSRPFVVDDVLATGGTAMAVCKILTEHFSTVQLAVGVIANLDFLPGRRVITQSNIPVISLVDYE